MPYYLMQESFPPNVWKSIIDGSMKPNPFSDPDVLNAGASILGGTVHSSWLSCQDCEYIWIVEMPGNIDVTSMTMMNLSRGNTHPIKITPLLSPEEAVKSIAIATKTMGYAETKGYRMDSSASKAEEKTTQANVEVLKSPDTLRQIDSSKSVYDITEQFPELIEIFATAGYTQARNKMIRQTIGRTMSLRSTIDVVAKDGVDLPKIFRETGFEIIGQG